MSFNETSLHGLLGLQSSFTATCVAEEPRTSWKFTWLILIPELCNHNETILDACVRVMKMALFYVDHLAGTVDVAGAVVLVDDDRILDVAHDGVLEGDPVHVPVARPPPSLDPYPVLRSRERDGPHRYVLHSGLLRRVAQAPDAASAP